MMWIKTLLFVFSCVIVVKSEVKFLSKCKLQDSECLRRVAQDFIPRFTAGIPEIGLEMMDPLYIDHVDGSNSILNFKATNVTIKGFDHTKMEEIVVDKAVSTIRLKIMVGIDFRSDYEMSGNLLILPIEGKGPMAIKIPKFQVDITMNIHRKSENDKNYFTVTYKNHSYSLKSKSEVRLKNLFSGNKALASAAEQMIAANGDEIIDTLGPPIVMAVIDSIAVRINEFLKAFDVKDLYIHED